MGYQLWMSPVTGYRRQGTRFGSLKAIFQENVSLKSVLEPVLFCKDEDNALDAKRALANRDFDTTCVVNNEGKIIGKINRAELGEGRAGEFVCEIYEEETVDENVSLVDLLNTLISSNFKYVISSGKIYGIITRSDINKPIPRTYLFGIVSLVELHMNFWVNFHHPETTWMNDLKKERQESINEKIQDRKHGGDYLTVIDCAQFSDKKEILRNTPKFLEQFEFSKKSYKGFMENMENMEKIRNEIAHSQTSIIGQLTWEVLASTMKSSEEFLVRSDFEIEKDGLQKSIGFDDDVLVPMVS